MARTTPMNLVELMIMKNDIRPVLEFLGKKGNFQFQNHKNDSSKVSDASRSGEAKNPERDLFVRLQDARSFLNVEDIDGALVASSTRAGENEIALAEKFLANVEELKKRQTVANDELKRVKESKEEAESFKKSQGSFLGA